MMPKGNPNSSGIANKTMPTPIPQPIPVAKDHLQAFLIRSLRTNHCKIPIVNPATTGPILGRSSWLITQPSVVAMIHKNHRYQSKKELSVRVMRTNLVLDNKHDYAVQYSSNLVGNN